MDNKRKELDFEEVLESEAEDIWDIFFPYITAKNGGPKEINSEEKIKTQRHLKFLSM